jgi:hypothetical protein
VVDPVVTGSVLKVAEGVGNEAAKTTSGLLSRALGPAADEIGIWLGRLTHFRLNNIQRIAMAAEKRGGEGVIHPRVVHQVLEDGSFCDSELLAEYFGGILASSRTPDGRSDIGVSWSSVVASMSSVQIRGHFCCIASGRNSFMEEQT